MDGNGIENALALAVRFADLGHLLRAAKEHAH
jgi:hypothetical protein